MGRKVKDGNKTYTELVTCVAKVLLRNGLDTDRVVTVSHEIGVSICQMWCGLAIYIPKLHLGALAGRDVALFAAFCQGATHVELARQHNITPRQVYAIIARERRKQRDELKRLRQGLISKPNQ